MRLRIAPWKNRMIVKRLVILANSIKNQKRCVAGREVWYSPASGHRLGAWVRPVGEVGKGELALEHSAMPDGSQPAVLDIIEVPLLEHAGDLTQPENWRLCPVRAWKKITSVPPVPLAILQERPNDLWHDWSQSTDRIAAEKVAAVGPSESLFLIRPRHFRLVASTKGEGPKGEPREHRRRRAVFEYGRSRYNLAVTDPTVDARYFTPFPTVRERVRKVSLPCGDECLLCVSRTPVFDDGNHYKIVATVIDAAGALGSESGS
ncbi:MAG: hypothetical protein WD768_21020 [Phycisphaeraceae bacterium]